MACEIKRLADVSQHLEKGCSLALYIRNVSLGIELESNCPPAPNDPIYTVTNRKGQVRLKCGLDPVRSFFVGSGTIQISLAKKLQWVAKGRLRGYAADLVFKLGGSRFASNTISR